MKENIFYILDVFAEKKFSGNQLAVVRIKNKISKGGMQEIAREINYSETTFVLSDKKRNNGYDVRIFTPKEEIPFAGHPTLGTAFIIGQEIIKKNISEIILNLKVGQITVTFTYRKNTPDVLWMKQNQPVFGKIFSRDKIAEMLSLTKTEVDPRFPIQEVSTGLPCIIVPIKNLKSVKDTKINQEKYFALIKNTRAKAILVFCPQTENHKNNLHVRVFCDYFGIPEDPATGSANGCLAGYLAKHKYFKEADLSLRIEQGYELGRPSLILLKTKGENIFIGGKVQLIVKGKFI